MPPPTPHALNPSQRAAVEHDLGPLLVLAGAGSGKTRVVTSRIARLLERGVGARSILAMTFTNKAAAEMRERVVRLVGAAAAKDLTVSTFHSFGMQVLAAEGKALGFKNGQFSIFDQADATGVIREILRTITADRRYDLSAILARISNAKNSFADETNMLDREADEYDEIAKVVLPRYRAALSGFHALDFDDLVCEPVRLWKRRPDILERWQERYRYLLVDEYQDTNHAQLEFVRLLAGRHNNVCVVGDDDQSIYAWRGADVTNILDFEEHFPGAKVVKLEENYRSTSAVLSVANAVLAKSQRKRHEKTLKAVRSGGAPVELIVATDAEVEAAFIGDEIHRLVNEGAYPRREVAVLFRGNLQSEPLEASLRERNIAFRLVGGTQFYERKEVKDLLAYLKVAVNPQDEISLRRIINYPARGIGEVALDRLDAAALARGHSLFQAVARAGFIPDLAGAAADGCERLVGIIGRARQDLERGAKAAEVASTIVKAISLHEDILAGSGTSQVAARRWGNVESLLGVFGRYDVRKPNGTMAELSELLRFLTLREQPEAEEGPDDRVTLTTMHGAKGLEFGCVFVAGLEEGLMPHSRSIDARATDVGGKLANDVEEERRLFYVSITRARDRLYLMRTMQRVLRGKPAPRVPSRFLADIPPELLVERQIAGASAPALSDTVSRAEALLAALGGPSASAARPARRPS